MARVKHHCCECGSLASDPNRFEFHDGRTACSQKCYNKLTGKGVPEHKRRGFYCNTHGKVAA